MDATTLLSLLENFNFSGVSFIYIKGYTSDKSGNSEIANILINVGASYANMKKNDLITLQNTTASELVTENFGQALIQQAIDEKIQSIVSPSKSRSNGQKDAFIKLNASGTLKYCKETGSVLISGTVVKKTVIQKGIYKEVKSKPLTLAKKHVDKLLDLKLAKIRYYKISNITTSVKVSGDTIEIG
jgi:hypothetical protein